MKFSVVGENIIFAVALTAKKFLALQGAYFCIYLFQIVLQSLMSTMENTVSPDHVSSLILLYNKFIFMTGQYQLINACHTQAIQMIHLIILYPAII